jgi:hypothetical protein
MIREPAGNWIGRARGWTITVPDPPRMRYRPWPPDASAVSMHRPRTAFPASTAPRPATCTSSSPSPRAPPQVESRSSVSTMRLTGRMACACWSIDSGRAVSLRSVLSWMTGWSTSRRVRLCASGSTTTTDAGPSSARATAPSCARKSRCWKDCDAAQSSGASHSSTPRARARRITPWFCAMYCCAARRAHADELNDS